jgi:tetratricopeptide (TPR) repeat protein
MSLGNTDSTAGAGDSTAKVFISYSRRDLEFADRIDAALKARGFDTLIDRSEIYALEDWWKRIEALIAQADTIVFILSPDAVASDVCQSEVRFAASLNKRLAPIVYRRVEDSRVPPELARLNFVFFDDPEQFDASLERLAEALETDIEWVRKHTEFVEQAQRWAGVGRPGPRGLLLRPPMLDEAERWIASRPQNAPMPTEAAQAFIAASRQAHTRRRNILSAGLAAGLFAALGLAGLAGWQWRVASFQRQRAEHSLALATDTANDLIMNIARKFRDFGVPMPVIKQILDQAITLQDQLAGGGETSPELQRSRAVGLTETSRALLSLGDTKGALAAAEKDRDIVRALLASTPDNVKWQHDLAVSDEKIGDVLEVQDDLTGALAAYREGQEIVKVLAQKQPNSADAQRDVSTSDLRICSALRLQGDIDDALTACRAGLTISKALLQQDPDSSLFQGDLSDSEALVGDVLQPQGDLTGALAAFRDSQTIMTALTQKDPSNTLWQNALASRDVRIGNVLRSQGDLAGALTAYREDNAILKALVQRDPDNTEWLHEISLSDAKIGDVLKAQGDLEGALAAYREDNAVSRVLAQKDPSNTEWQQALLVGDDTIGNMLRGQGDLAGALAAYREENAISEALSQKDPSNADWQRDQSLSKGKIGGVLRAQGDLADGLAAYREYHAISEALAQKDPSNVQWQTDVVMSLWSLATAGDNTKTNLTEALAILKRLDAADLLTTEQKGWVPKIEAALDKAS